MQIIDSTTVRVDSYQDLVDILTVNSAYTYIYLGADINMPSGIRLHNDRSLVVIDGEWPQDSGIFHVLQDADADSGMIYKNNISDLKITLQNMTIAGRNYYGMPRIADGNTGVILTYQNVTYTGPQITWHWSGLTRYIDCDITITRTGASPSEEVAEACHVEIGGNTRIDHSSATYPVFNFRKAGASLTILKDANVQITTNNDFFMEEQPVQFVIGPSANLTLTAQRGISRSSSYQAASFLVDEGATFDYIQLSNATGDAALYVNGPFTVNSGARVYMQAAFTGSSASKRLVQFTASSTTRGLYLHDPKSFVLYTQGPGTAIYFQDATPFEFSCGQVNFWRDAAPLATAGTFDDPPLYPWHDPDWIGFEIKGSANTASTGITSSTLPAGIQPPLGNLQLHNARVLSVGELPLEVFKIVDNGTPITGTSDPLANIKAEYAVEGTAHTLTGTANEKGAFSLSTPASIALGTEVTVSANVPFLYRTKTETVIFAGELYIESAPDVIPFIAPAISVSPQCILGRGSNIPVVVVDTRVYGSQWELMASIDAPMFCPESSRMFPGQVVFVPVSSAYEDEEPIEPGVYKRVRVGGPSVTRTSVEWEDRMGILLHVTGAIHLGDRYRANLYWQVRPVTP